jgi:putative chitinase
MKKLITESEREQIKKMHSLNESMLSDVVDKIKDLPDFEKIKTKFKEITGIDLESKVGPIEKTKQDDTIKKSDVNYTGKVDYSKGGFDEQQKQNIEYLLSEMEKRGIKDPYTQIGILSVISKECNFKPKSEVDYSNTSNSRIRKIFGKRVRGYSEQELNKLKSNPKNFFNKVYANIIGNGDVSTGDGYKYRGRGFNQLTGRGNYKKYGSLAGIDLVSNPDILNREDVAAKVALQFLTKGKTDFPDFENKKEAAEYFADVNAGGGRSSHRANAVKASEKFDVK